MSPLPAARVDAPTEHRNPRTLEIDAVPTLEVLRLLNAEDRIPADAVAAVLPRLATVVDETVRRLRAGAGSTTSARHLRRIAVMDAAELIPTFSLPPGIVVAHIAGGAKALTIPVEGSRTARQPASPTAPWSPRGRGDRTHSQRPHALCGRRTEGGPSSGRVTVLISANPDAELAPWPTSTSASTPARRRSRAQPA